MLIENSILHFMAVTIGSFAAAAVLAMLLNLKRTRRANSIESRDRAWAEINMANLRHNVKVLQKMLPAGCKILAVVKATSVLFHYGLSQTVVDVEHARELNCFGKPIQVHIKVDTGMNRLGESYQHVSEIASIFGCKNLKVAGIFTHLCVSDSLEESDVAFTNQQIQNFYELLDKLKAKHIQIPPIHIQGSYGVLNYPELQCSYARIGIALYYNVVTLIGKDGSEKITSEQVAFSAGTITNELLSRLSDTRLDLTSKK